ncbi:hypothetical protein L208DRAFT_1377585 [Tricholoma matsutake]|nr:hypothetical protein L208DRAFT_1377585 [Tricholoma matsutake 945]
MTVAVHVVSLAGPTHVQIFRVKDNNSLTLLQKYCSCLRMVEGRWNLLSVKMHWFKEAQGLIHMVQEEIQQKRGRSDIPKQETNDGTRPKTWRPQVYPGKFEEGDGMDKGTGDETPEGTKIKKDDFTIKFLMNCGLGFSAWSYGQYAKWPLC